MTPSPAAAEIERFAAEVGRHDPVRVAGGRTQWDVGGEPAPARELRAPTGVVEHHAGEMTVRLLAGTTVAAVDAVVGAAGQRVALPAPDGATAGGVLAVGRSGIRRLGDGPVRDAVLEVTFVGADGSVVRAGGPTVKNVSGYDLCRLLVGSLGTLGLLAEVVLRTRPVPAAARWMAGEVDPFAARAALHRPASLLWDGVRTWALLEGALADVDQQSDVAAAAGLTDEVGGPPPLPPHRWSLRPSELWDLPAESGRFVAEVGVGVVHAEVPQERPAPPAPLRELHRRLAHRFDPEGRLNPGRSPMAAR